MNLTEDAAPSAVFEKVPKWPGWTWLSDNQSRALVSAPTVSVPAFVQDNSQKIGFSCQFLFAAADLCHRGHAGRCHKQGAVDIGQECQHVVAAENWRQVDDNHRGAKLVVELHHRRSRGLALKQLGRVVDWVR